MTNEDVIKILESMKTDLYGCGVDENNIIYGRDIQALNFAIKALEERPQGEWIIAEKITCAKCPFCEHLTEQAINYCPWCGAKMT